MKTLLLILLGWSCTTLAIAQDPYLEIETSRNDYIFYPPNTDFDIYDASGTLVFTEKDLNKDIQIELEGKHTIQLYVSWGDGQNKIEVHDAILNLRTSEKEMNSSATNYSHDWSSTDQPALIKKEFIKNDNGTFDLDMKFEGDIRFTYENGEATISEKGEILPMVGKYVAKTSRGYLKISYQPKSTECWHVFTSEKLQKVHIN